MRINKLSRPLQAILLIGFTLALSSCESVQIKNRTAYFANGELSLGATGANTVGTPSSFQITTEQALDILEARAATSSTPAHAPGVFESASDYGEETTELETACRLLKDNCSYALQTTVQNRKQIVKQLDDMKSMLR